MLLSLDDDFQKILMSEELTKKVRKVGVLDLEVLMEGVPVAAAAEIQGDEVEVLVRHEAVDADNADNDNGITHIPLFISALFIYFNLLSPFDIRMHACTVLLFSSRREACIVYFFWRFALRFG